MKWHRFLIKESLDSQTVRTVDKDLIHQWRSVLRFGVGDKLILFNDSGVEVKAEFTNINNELAELKVIEKLERNKSNGRKVYLYLALIKQNNFELAVEKATEVGVASITPLITERTVKLGFRSERLEKIIKEASEQSGRTNIPSLNEPIKLAEALTLAKSDGQIVFCDPSGTNLNSILSNTSIPSITSIFIGPEGGWSQNELTLAREHGAQIASLGQTILRAETATIVASYWQVNL